MSTSLKGVDQARKALAYGRPALVWRQVVADTETPVGAALKLFCEGRGDFLLESVEGGDVRGRYSLMGLDPDLVFRATGDRAEINRDWQNDRHAFHACEGGTLENLRALVESCRCDVPSELPPALACLVGHFGYETIGLVEKLPRPPHGELDLPDMLFVRPTVLLVFDRLSDALFCVAPVWDELAMELAGERIDDVLRKLAQQLPPSANTVTDHPDPSLAPTMSAADYEAMVLKAQDYISAGDIFQVVLSQRFTSPFTLPPMDLYRALRRVNPSPFLYFLDMPGFAIVGSSPEILVRVRDGEVTIRPIAGTRPRGANSAADRLAEQDLLADPKERAEHLMLLDLGRNDVGRVAASGTVTVTESFTVERYSHVMHIVSNVVGELREGEDGLSALLAGLPAGTVSGAPKVRAMQIIDELEPEKRGVYAGAVGYFAGNGEMDMCIALRTGVVKDGSLYIQAGGGVVYDSDPEAEFQETVNKSRALQRAAESASRFVRGGNG